MSSWWGYSNAVMHQSGGSVALFFISFIILVSFAVLSLFVAIVVFSFSSEQQHLKALEQQDADQQRLDSMLQALQPETENVPVQADDDFTGEGIRAEEIASIREHFDQLRKRHAIEDSSVMLKAQKCCFAFTENTVFEAVVLCIVMANATVQVSVVCTI